MSDEKYTTDALLVRITDLEKDLVAANTELSQVRAENNGLRPQISVMVGEIARLKHELATYQALEPRPHTEVIPARVHG